MCCSPPCISSFAKIHLKLSENIIWRYSPKTQWFTEFSVKILSIFAIFAVSPQNLERILRKWNIFIIFMPGCRFLINYSFLAIHLLLQIWGRKNRIHWVFSDSLSFQWIAILKTQWFTENSVNAIFSPSNLKKKMNS